VEGHPPFDREGALASLTAVVTEEPDPPAHAGPLWPVISGLLRKDPDQRLTASEVEEQLQPLAEPEADDERQADPGAQAPGGADRAQPGTGPLPAPVDTEARAAAQPGAPPAEAPASAAAPAESDQAESDQAEGAQPGTARPEVARPAATGGSAHATSGRPRPRVILAAAAAAVVVAGIVVSVVLASANSSGRPGAAAPPASSSSRSAPASKRPTASPSTRTSPTASPSASASASGGTGAIPAGFYRFTNSTGFSIGVPKGWQVQHVGHYVYLRDPADSGVFLLIDQSDQPQPNALADWKAQAAARQSSYPNYHLLRLHDVSYPQAEQAADWEFTYDRDGVQVHILNRNVLANSAHAYALYWSTPDSDWTSDFHYFQTFAKTFQPAGVDQG
jgi:hypothetical protein